MWDKIFETLRAVFGERGLAALALLGITAVAIWVLYGSFSESTRYPSQKYFDLKVELTKDATKAASQIATSLDADTIRKAAVRFDELYWGELVLVESTEPEGAMVSFRTLIAQPGSRTLDVEKIINGTIKREELQRASLQIARAGFNLLQPRWLDQVELSFVRLRRSDG